MMVGRLPVHPGGGSRPSSKEDSHARARVVPLRRLDPWARPLPVGAGSSDIAAWDLEVVLLRVVEPIPPVVLEGARYVEVEDVEARRTDAEEYLAPIAVELRNKAVRVES